VLVPNKIAHRRHGRPDESNRLKRSKGRLSLAVDGDAICRRTCALAPVIAT
jgi:hypothetical protein